jgi:hypothetical protein
MSQFDHDRFGKLDSDEDAGPPGVFGTLLVGLVVVTVLLAPVLILAPATGLALNGEARTMRDRDTHATLRARCVLSLLCMCFVYCLTADGTVVIFIYSVVYSMGLLLC